MTARLQITILVFSLLCMQSQAGWWWKKSDKTQSNPVKTKPEQAQPAQAKPAQAKPEQVQPAQAKPVQAGIKVANGMTEQELLSALGEPKGIISGGARKTLMYDGVQIEILNGRVINLPDDFSTQLKNGQKKQAQKDAFRTKQKKKGLVFHDGEWMKPAEKKKRQAARIAKAHRPAKKARASSSYVMRGKDNRPIDHSRYLRRGLVTVVDFYADWCGPCRTLAPKLDKLIKSHSGVVLQKVNIGNWGSSVAERYNVTSVPNVRVFDRNGNMVAPPTSNLGKIDANIKRAKKQ